MGLQEAEKRVKFVFNRHLHIVVQKRRWCYRFKLGIGFILITSLFPYSLLNRVEVVDLNKLSITAKLDPCKVFERLRHSGRE